MAACITDAALVGVTLGVAPFFNTFLGATFFRAFLSSFLATWLSVDFMHIEAFHHIILACVLVFVIV